MTVTRNAHDQMPTCGRLLEGVGIGIRLVEEVSPQDLLRVGEDVLLVEAEKYHDLLFLWVYMLVRRHEGKTQKLAEVRALPRGGGVPYCWPFY